jgi:hypothetical protein
VVKISQSEMYQLKVTLDGITPPIWRRLLLPASISLKGLHDVLQKAMGWTNSHLHQFEAQGQIFGIPDPEVREATKSEARTQLGEVLQREKDTMLYEYDFGDGWIHKIVLEQIGKAADGVAVSSCIGGARACPPEDCGGPPGYEEFLTAVGDPSHLRHKEMTQWIGGPFDSDHFDVKQINKLLARRRRRG